MRLSVVQTRHVKHLNTNKVYDTITRYSPHVHACVSQLSIHISTPAACIHILPGIPLTRGTCALTEAEMFMTIATLS